MKKELGSQPPIKPMDGTTALSLYYHTCHILINYYFVFELKVLFDLIVNYYKVIIVFRYIGYTYSGPIFKGLKSI